MWTHWLSEMAVCFVQSTLWEVHNRESDSADQSTDEAAVSAEHPRHYETKVTEVSCARVLFACDLPVKRSP